MSVPRLQRRVPSAKVIGTYQLANHKLCFHKLGVDGSAKCDALMTNNPDDLVYGVVFEFNISEKPRLDRVEGLGVEYFEKIVLVSNAQGQKVQASLYYASRISTNIQPYHWYQHHVLYGAQQAGLPAFYIEQIRTSTPIVDLNRDRSAAELAIYL